MTAETTTTTPSPTTTPNESTGSCCDQWRLNCLKYCPFLGFLAFSSVLLFLGPLFALIFAIVLMSSFIIYKDIQLRRRGQMVEHEPSTDIEALAQHAKSNIPAVDVSSIVLRIVQANDPAVTCEICLDDLVAGEEVAGSANSECIHEFHVNCIRQALNRRTTCPCCRREYLLSHQTETSPPVDIEQGSTPSFVPSRLHTEEDAPMPVATGQEFSPQTDEAADPPEQELQTTHFAEVQSVPDEDEVPL